MKELEKTKRISIAAVLTILVILIALLSYKKPKHLYKNNPGVMLDNLTATNNFIELENVDESMQLIDVRNVYEFEKGHLENAINIYAHELLNPHNSTIIDSLQEQNKTLVLYGGTPDETLVPYMVLYQLGYINIKLLPISIEYEQNELVASHIKIEQSKYDIPEYIKASIKKAAVKPKPLVKYIQPPKKVVPQKKKKKMPVEGGC